MILEKKWRCERELLADRLKDREEVLQRFYCIRQKVYLLKETLYYLKITNPAKST
jgi:hypothetical protein